MMTNPYFDIGCKATHSSHSITCTCSTESAASLVTHCKKKVYCCRYFSAEQNMRKGQWEGGLWKVIKREKTKGKEMKEEKECRSEGTQWADGK